MNRSQSACRYRRGFVRTSASISIAGPGGDIPVQTALLDAWPDGSARWVLCDFQADAPAEYRIGFTGGSPIFPDALRVNQDQDALSVASHDLVFRIGGTGSLLLEVLEPARSASFTRRVSCVLTTAEGTELQPTLMGATVEAAGPLRAAVRLDGEFANGLHLTVRAHFFAATSTARFELALHNPKPAVHADGFWELGDAGSVLFRDCSLRIETGVVSAAFCSVGCARAVEST